MWTLLITLVASAQDAPSTGSLVIDARQAIEVVIDGESYAQLFQPGHLTLEVPAGERSLKVFINGTPTERAVNVSEGAPTHVLVGRSGLSIEAPQVADATDSTDEEPAGPVELQVRVMGDEGVRMVVNGTRHQFALGAEQSLDLPPGRHRIALQNAEGTVIWARGLLHLEGPDPVVMLVSAGRMPEVAGQGRFTSGG